MTDAPLTAGANNYLGLSNHPAIAKAAMDAIMSHGYGMSSVRFICGTLVSAGWRGGRGFGGLGTQVQAGWRGGQFRHASTHVG